MNFRRRRKEGAGSPLLILWKYLTNLTAPTVCELQERQYFTQNYLFSLLDPKFIESIWCGDAGELGEAEAEPKRAGEALGPLEVATLFELVLNFYQKNMVV